ncbi:MAG: hypothetical protein WA110_07775 [Anaerolineaceae bacterium]
MFSDRINLYKSLSSVRQRPLISYVTSIRPNLNGSMSQDALPSFLDHVDSIVNESDLYNKGKAIDVLIISNGGDPVVSWRIISLLREKFKNITVIVPYTAFSAATLLALGADEIIMHPYSNLGPLDPQITISNSDGSSKSMSYEDIIKYFEFIKDVGITDQELLERSLSRLSQEIPPTAIGFSKRSSQLGLTMGAKLLSTHMSDENKARGISETLNTKFYHHGYPLSRSEAKDIGLNIAANNNEIEILIWNIYKDFEREMKFGYPFNPKKEIFEKITQQANLEKNKLYSIEEKSKIASIESLCIESWVEINSVMLYTILDDGSMQQNLQIQQSNWITEETKNA